MNLSRRGFLEAATVLALSGAISRAQSQSDEPVELAPIIDIEGVKNASARRLLQRAFDLPGRLWNPILSPHGKQLVCGNFGSGSADFYIFSLVNNQIKVKKIFDPDRNNPKRYQEVSGRDKQFFRVGSANAFSPDGKIFATGSYGNRVSPVDDSIQLWDTKTWRKIGVLKGHLHTVNSIFFSPDGKKIISGNKGSSVIIHNVVSHSIDSAWFRIFEFGYGVSAAFWNDGNGLIPIAVVQKRLKIEGIESGFFFPPSELEIAPDKVIVAPDMPVGDFEIWNLATNAKIKDLKLPGDKISVNETIDFSGDGSVMALRTGAMASNVELDLKPSPRNSEFYDVILADWANDKFSETKVTSPSKSDFSPFYISLRFLPNQSAVLLSDTPADRLAVFDASSLDEPQASAH